MTEDDHKRERESFAAIIESLEKSVRAHRTGIDGWLYNGGTVVTLVLMATVSILSGKIFPTDTFAEWMAPMLSATAGLVVALERSLGF